LDEQELIEEASIKGSEHKDKVSSSKIQEVDTAVIKLEEENSNLTATITKLKLENERMRGKYMSVQEENKELKEKVQDLNAELQTVIDLSQKESKGFDITQEEIKRANEEINTLKQEKQDTAIIIEELQKRGQHSIKLKEDYEHLKNINKELELELKIMLENSKKTNEELSNYKSTLLTLQELSLKIEALESEIIRRDEVIKKLQVKNKEGKDIEVTYTDSKQAFISGDSVHVNTRISQLQDLIGETSEGIRSLRESNMIENDNKEIERLKVENKKLSSRVIKLEEENTELSRTMAELEQSKSNSTEEQLHEELKKSNEEIIELREKNEESNKKVQELLKNKIESTNKVFKLEKELEELYKVSKSVGKLEEELKVRNEKLLQLESENAQLNVTLQEMNHESLLDLKVKSKEKDEKLKELHEKILNEYKVNEEYDKKIKQLQDFSKVLQEENSQMKKLLHDSNLEKDEIQVEYRKTKQSKDITELNELINNIREENEQLTSNNYKGASMVNSKEDERVVQEQIRVLKHELTVNIHKRITISFKELVQKLSVSFEPSLNDIVAQFEVMYKRLDSLNRKIPKRLLIHKLTSTKAVQVNELIERVKTHTVVQSPERIKSYSKGNYDWGLINELRILRQENEYLHNKIANYPVDVAVLKKELERIQKNSAITINELKIQNHKWMLNLKKCIEEFRKVQDEVAALKGERADTSRYIYQLKLRLANMQILFNGCSNRNCILENNSMIQHEKIEELESEIRTITKERASSAYGRQKSSLME
jgi:chromosome segregation ATPase